MPPFLPPHLVILIVSLFLAISAAVAHSCSSSKHTLCPPFTSTPPPFPFSSTPGCGHPAFQIQCSSPHSTISINNVSFSLLHFQPNSTSLLLSPQLSPSPSHQNCSSSKFITIPTRPINLSYSPFKVSDSSCSRLSLLRPCPPPNLPNCSLCSWDCKLIKAPVNLIHTCENQTSRRQVSEQGCQSDILGYLDNYLRKFGIQVEWDADQDDYFTSCSDCRAKKGVCGFNSSDPGKPFLCFHTQSSISPKWVRHNYSNNKVALLSSLFLIACLMFVVSIFVIIFRFNKLKSVLNEEDPTTIFLRNHRSNNLLPPVFSYEELEISTNGFDPKRKIGDGGFGSVYLGQLNDGKFVAIKHLHKGKAFSTKSFCNEILILSSIDHPNLVKLHGYCSDPRGLLLVYDYVENGTLADHLHGLKSLYRKGFLTWEVRVDIALQIALALEYLHFSVQPPIVHRDLTSQNIFVDKDMKIRVGDFGLSRLLPETTSSGTGGSSDSGGFVWTGPQGTPGYLDPDYYRSFKLTEKSDVYSFGVVLLELITGLKAVDQNRDKREMALAEMMVSKIQMGLLNRAVDISLIVDGVVMDGVDSMAELAFRCVVADKDDRPDSREIVAELKHIGSRVRGGCGVVRASSSSNAAIVPDSIKF